MDSVKDVAQIIYYITLSVAGPLALFEFLKARKADRRANEYKIYDELNDRFFEYQKIALEYYDLDILDVPNNDPSLAFDKKRKQEMVAHAMLFSLFERAFLMFHQQEDQFRLRSGPGGSTSSTTSFAGKPCVPRGTSAGKLTTRTFNSSWTPKSRKYTLPRRRQRYYTPSQHRRQYHTSPKRGRG